MISHNQRAKENLATATNAVKKCSGVVKLINNAASLIHEEKYCTALRKMEDIEKQLSSLGKIRFVSLVRDWVASMNNRIAISTKNEMCTWLVNIRNVSYELGSAAIRCYSLTSHESAAHAKDQSQTMANPLCRQSSVTLEVLQQVDSAKHINSVQMMSSTGNNGDRSTLPMTYSVAFILQLKAISTCQFDLPEEEILECVPGFSYDMVDVKWQAKEDEKLLDNIASHCYPVHRAVYVFHLLDKLDDFYRWYVDNRLPMAELHSMIMHDLDNLDACGFLTYLSTLASCIAGFFIVENTLQQKVKHKGGILTSSDLQKAWVRCQNSLSNLILQHIQSISRPTHFMQVKETLLSLIRLGIDLDFDTQPIYLLLNILVEKFGRVLYVSFKEKCKCVFEDEMFQPMVVQTNEELESTITPFDLHIAISDDMNEPLPHSRTPGLLHCTSFSVSGHSSHHFSSSSISNILEEYSGMPPAKFNSAPPIMEHSPGMASSSSTFDLPNDKGYDSSSLGPIGESVVEFPIQMPFSKTVPLLSAELFKMAAMMLTFVSYIEVINLSSFLVKISKMGVGAINHLMSEQLDNVSNSGQIFRACQISINCCYLERVPLAIKKSLQGCLNSALATEALEPSTWRDGGSSSSMNEKSSSNRSSNNNKATRSKTLRGLARDAQNSIVKLVIQKVDVLLQGMIDFVNWEPSGTSGTPNTYCEDVTAYLSTTFEQFEGLPAIARNEMFSTCIEHVHGAILDNLLGPDIPFLNGFALTNLQVDVKAIEEFAATMCTSRCDHMKHSMSGVSQLLDAVLENQESVLIDETKREAKYPALDVNHLVKLYSKFNDVGVATQIKNTVGNELQKPLNKQDARRIRHQLKAQGYDTAGNEQHPKLATTPSLNARGNGAAMRIMDRLQRISMND